jgi:Coenzyme PQQ synthesis protein D (PqqD)
VLVFDGDMIHLMEGSGAEIWRAIDGRRTADQIVADLVRRHAATPAVESDVRAFIDDLVSRGLVAPHGHRREAGYELASHVAWTSDGAAITLLDLISGQRQTLSLTASRTWVHLADGLSLEATLTRLAEEFPDAPPSFAEETEAFVGLLCDQGLLAPMS